MEFEFDENKSRSNKTKHGINFYESRKLWDDPNYITFPLPYVEEDRHAVIAKLEGKIWTAIVTYRGANIRIISVRRARKNEREVYENN